MPDDATRAGLVAQPDVQCREDARSSSARRRQRLALGGVLVVSLIVRLVGIQWGLPRDQRLASYEPDEQSFISMIGYFRPREFNLHPGPMITQAPTFTTYALAASLVVASKLGLVPLVADKLFYRERPEALAAVILTGRLNSVLFGVLAVLVMYCLARRLRPDQGWSTALLAALGLALLPGHVAWCHHLSQYPPLVFWHLLFWLALIVFLEQPSPGRLAAAGAAFGCAVGTAYNVAPQALILALASFMVQHPTPWRRRCLCLLAGLGGMVVGFAVVMPYGLLDPDALSGAYRFARSVGSEGGPAIRWLPRILLSTLPSAVGWPTLIVGAVGAFGLARRNGSAAGRLLSLWLSLYLFFFLRLGAFASSARSLPITVLLPLTAAVYVGDLAPRRRRVGCLLASGMVLWGMAHTVTVDGFFTHDQTRLQASRWVTANVPAAARIGYVNKVFWWSPDFLFADYWYPLLTGGRYHHLMYYYGTEKLIAEPCDYLIATPYEDRDPVWIQRPAGLHVPDRNFHRLAAQHYDQFLEAVQSSYVEVARFTLDAPFFLPRWQPLPDFFHHLNGMFASYEIIIYRRGRAAEDARVSTTLRTSGAAVAAR